MKNKKTIVILLILVFISFSFKDITSEVCEATPPHHCYYADNHTDGDCSFASPCSIQTALESAGGGDYVYLLNGTYSEFYSNYQLQAIINMDKYFSFSTPTTRQNPVTIKTYPGDRPVIKGDNTRQCIMMEQSNVIFDGLIVKNCGTAGIRIGYDLHPDNVIVRNCDFSEIYASDNHGGIYVQGSSNVLIENNAFHDNHYKGGDRNGNGIQIFVCNNITIRNNEFYNLGGALYYKHGEASPGAGGYTHIFNNYLHDMTPGHGIATNQNRAEIKNNVVAGSSILIHNEDGTIANFTFDVGISHNTLINSHVFFPWQGGDAQFSGPVGTRVYDNIFYNTTYSIWEYGSDEKYYEGVNLTSDHNCFYNPGGQQEICYFCNSNPAHGGENTGGTYTLTQWKNIGFGEGSIETDPRFMNPSGKLNQLNDFALLSYSPCRGAGRNGEDMGADINLVGIQGSNQAICGNGIIEQGEQCDDGNTITENCTYGQTSCIVCSSTCQNISGLTSYCGDGSCDMVYENSTTCSKDCSGQQYFRECENWQSKHSEWIFCDDFESNEPLVENGRYFEYDNDDGDFIPLNHVGLENSRGMRVLWQQGEIPAGSIDLAFGRNPSSYMNRGIRPNEDFREIYYRMYMKLGNNWEGNPFKLSRATVIAANDWSQAMIAHLWGDNADHLLIDPVRCVDENGNVKCKGYNDFQHMDWLGNKAGTTQIFDGNHNSRWYCIEAHVKLNDPGMQNGLQEFWIDGNLEARRDNLDFVRNYTDYGINAIFFENYWNSGSPKEQERYFDNIVVSTQRIGCISLGINDSYTCGNGIIEQGEQCDDGNTITENCTYGQTSCIVCSSTCQNISGSTSYCGDGVCDALHENSTTCSQDCSSQQHQCTSGADTSHDGKIETSELINYINQWLQGNATINQVVRAIKEWKSGC